MRGAPVVNRLTALAAGFARFSRCEFMRSALLVGGLSSLARDFRWRSTSMPANPRPDCAVLGLRLVAVVRTSSSYDFSYAVAGEFRSA